MEEVRQTLPTTFLKPNEQFQNPNVLVTQTKKELTKPRNPKTSRGRQKIEIKEIKEDSKRHVTFSKRRRGLFKKAAELNPANAGMAYYNMGATLTNRGQMEQAMSFFKKAIELDPKYANAYYQMGLATVGTNKMAEAAPYFTKYLELAPTGQDAETAKQMLDFIKKEGAAAPAAPAGGASKAQPGRK